MPQVAQASLKFVRFNSSAKDQTQDFVVCKENTLHLSAEIPIDTQV